ncbi:MAG: hypothetical protein JSS24_04740 [Proteobacteria bacterium]|nr:hypothetical protein [Pseudomonadota bacterium]
MTRLPLISLALICWRPACAAIDMDTAARIYEAAAVRDQVRASLSAMPGRIRDMFVAEAKTPLTEAQLSAIKDAAARGFRIDVFEPAAIAALAEQLDEPTAKKVLKFLSGELGTRMVAADKALSSLDEPTIDKVMSGEVKPPGSPGREALFGKLEAAARSTESTVQIFSSMGRAVAIGTAIGTGADPAAVEQRSHKAADAARKDLENGMREPLRRYMTYGYRDLSDAELRQLLSFLQSKVGTRYVNAYTAAMAAGFDSMGKRCGEQLGGSLRDLAQAQAQTQTLQPAPPATTPAQQ